MVDCGVGIRTMQAEMRHLGTNPKSFDGLLITHEHGDHIRTLHRVMRSDLPVIATAGTADLSGISRSQLLPCERDRPVEFIDFTIWPLRVRHDAIDPCGYLIEMPEARITILTDLGTFQDHLSAPIAASDLIVLEANHDEQMLRSGPYPVHLKRRVASPVGHLSNEACGAALAGVARDVRSDAPIWLAHLSDTNNRPHIAEATVRTALQEVDIDLSVFALPRRSPGPVWTAPAALESPALPFVPDQRASPSISSVADDPGKHFQASLFD